MIYKYFKEFIEGIYNHNDCTLNINKRLEEYLTRLDKKTLIEIRNLLKRRNIKIKLVKQPSDDWDKDWNWTGRSKYE